VYAEKIVRNAVGRKIRVPNKEYCSMKGDETEIQEHKAYVEQLFSDMRAVAIKLMDALYNVRDLGDEAGNWMPEEFCEKTLMKNLFWVRVAKKFDWEIYSNLRKAYLRALHRYPYLKKKRPEIADALEVKRDPLHAQHETLKFVIHQFPRTSMKPEDLVELVDADMVAIEAWIPSREIIENVQDTLYLSHIEVEIPAERSYEKTVKTLLQYVGKEFGIEEEDVLRSDSVIPLRKYKKRRGHFCLLPRKKIESKGYDLFEKAMRRFAMRREFSG